MADQLATVSIQTLVKRFVLKYKINEDDYINYLEHAADCVRDLNISHLSYHSQSNLALDSVGKVAFPTDMIDFISVGMVVDDVYYTFIESRDLNIPTEAITHQTGDENKYFYYLDWVNRYIYCQTLIGETITLRYISSGISTTAETLVPIQTTQVLDAYLRWMQSLMDGNNLGEQQLRKRTYDDLVMHLKWQMLPTLEQMKDSWLGIATDDTPLIRDTTGTSSSSSGTGDMNAYTATIDLSAGTNTVTTTLTVNQEPIAITLWDSSGNLLPMSGFTINFAVVGGFWTMTIYSVDAMSDVEMRIAY